jgi:ribonuclease HI
MITIYTDGAAKGNPGPGGYGTVMIYKQHRKELSEGFRLTTNNRMELLAVIKGLEELKIEGLPVQIYSDSKYVVDSVEKGWIWSWQKKGFKDKKNVDLWKRYIPLHLRFKPKFVWVKGHAGNVENERCDVLAVEASMAPGLKADIGYESNRS